MWIDFTPLIRHRDYRLLYFSQLVSFFGSMVTYVALPYQVFQLTQSTFSVGVVGLIELIPLLATAFLAGLLADTLDRRKLLVLSEIGLSVASAFLTLNAMLAQPRLWAIYLIPAVM